ncbi:pimeloyl-ACP methyl ester esterase BioH [Snodgrassella alvi]|uniref:pimeloyl-ACP methyl ester esterase BioH n=1 Tax=Snodgrassella alvi TaxID=1196083 RepID=UPI0034613E71
MTTPSQTLLIHGWGANHHIFDPFLASLPLPYQNHIQTPDLPGHGCAPFDGTFDINTIADQLAAQLSEPAHVLGWSLGGMVAISLAARYPDRVATLCLTASLAKLLASSDYPQGLQKVSLHQMADKFRMDYPKYMQQFLQLQMLYADTGIQTGMHHLLPAICQYGAPVALNAALHALEQADLRPLLSSLHCPVLLVYGGRDTITPPRMGEYLHQQLPQSEWHLLPQAAHTPFLSHPDEFARVLGRFWEQYT